MQRRSLLTFAAALPSTLAAAARAQGAVRRLGVLVTLAADDPRQRQRIAAFEAGLKDLGWQPGGSVAIEYRYAPGIDGLAKAAAELVALQPEVVLVQSNPGTAAMMRETRSIPIVVILAADPVGSGYVRSLSRPDGNVTGFTTYSFDIAAKWLQILQEFAPALKSVGVLMHAETNAHQLFYKEAAAVAPSLGIETVPLAVRNQPDIEAAIAGMAGSASAGLMALPHPVTMNWRHPIAEQAARHRLPAIYPFREHVEAGGLLSYGIDVPGVFRRAADYASRILRGARLTELPFQQPTEFELVVNLKTAKALGLTLPPPLLARANEVIE